MNFWRTLVGKLWITITCLVACVLMLMGLFLLPYIDTNFTNSGAVKRLFVIVAMIGSRLRRFLRCFCSQKSRSRCRS
ncbi:hypothetical protein HMSSN036_04040 [Paenibacillus macerans]|nr:hypothetical protein HMSSN036_04040 [Paenibacillus macerans]